MKILTVNQSDIRGGAARAAYRLHNALRRYGENSLMLVNDSISNDWTVQSSPSIIDKIWNRLSPFFVLPLNNLLKTNNHIIHSPALMPSRLLNQLNKSDVEIIHLHWINKEMLSIAAIGKLNKPVVWTLHDMWAFCGAEHYTENFRWKNGYCRSNRPTHESGFDLNRWTWKRKLKHWKNQYHIVTPSQWLTNCVKESSLMHDWPVTTIPNTIDTNVWKPINQTLAREVLNLPIGVPLLMFGAIGGYQDHRKGFDLLLNALNHLRDEESASGAELVIFGQLAPRIPPKIGFPFHFAGFLNDDISLSLLYSAADLVVVPSRQEVFGQTASEAHACGTPVVAFDTGGLPDIVEHKRTGYLAKAFDPVDMAEGLMWVLKDSDRRFSLGQAARKKAIKMWSYEAVAPLYSNIYQHAIKNHSR